MVNLLLIELAFIIIYMTVWYFVSRALSRFDVADIAWGGGFIITALTAGVISESLNPRAYLVMALVSIWGVRLSLHVYLRNRKKPEDARYRAWRQEWGKHANMRAFLQVFLLQGLLLLVIALPASSVVMAGGKPCMVLDAIGVFLWITGFLFEAAGDWQLLHFKQNHSNKGKIISTGLWRYSRHPNYFGEVTLWWGIYLIALAGGAGWATIIGPLTITFLILRVSGIPMLEKKYEGNPEFEEYRKRTSAFFPLPPKQQQ
jgi:steroid 5-alpha reductase family enzyme